MSGGSPPICARRLPDLHVSASHEVLPRFREYERCSTTAIDAYLSPLLGRYLGRLGEAAGDAGLPRPLVMQSSGGVAPAAEAARAGAWSVLSGPAGGAVGAGLLARASGDGNALGFDMGGTSCDVCVVEDGEVRRTDSRKIAGRPIQLPMVDVHTVGAGGGSIGWRDSGGALRVGPALGRRRARARLLRARRRRADGDRRQPRARLPRRRLAPRRRPRPRRRCRPGGDRDPRPLARPGRGWRPRPGSSASPTRRWCGRCGSSPSSAAVDPRGFALMPFGGAGPMHAAAIAAELGIETILCPRAGGVLSALGLCASDRRRDTARTVMLSGAGLSAERIAAEVDELIAATGAELEGARPEVVYALRYAGQAFELAVPGPVRPRPGRPDRGLRAHPRGALRPPRPRWRGRARRHPPGDGRAGARVRSPRQPRRGSLEESFRQARFGGAWVETPVLRGEPPAGAEASGPVVFELPEATLVLPPGWRAEVDEAGTIRARFLATDGSNKGAAP